MSSPELLWSQQTFSLQPLSRDAVSCIRTGYGPWTVHDTGATICQRQSESGNLHINHLKSSQIVWILQPPWGKKRASATQRNAATPDDIVDISTRWARSCHLQRASPWQPSAELLLRVLPKRRFGGDKFGAVFSGCIWIDKWGYQL